MNGDHGFRGRRRWGLTLLAFVVAGTLALPALYWLAILVSPPVTSDGHPVMPIGQVAFAIVLAPVLGAIVAYFAGRR